MMTNRPDNMNPEDRKNLITFAIVALILWIGFDHFVMQPKIEQARYDQMIAATETPADAQTPRVAVKKDRASLVQAGGRVSFENEAVAGSIALKGGRIDDLSLKRYYKTIDKKDNVVLLSPAGTEFAKYADFGWLAATGEAVPGPDTMWTASGSNLSPDHPVTLSWNNGQGLSFERVIAIDGNYMMTVTDRVSNRGGKTATLYPYALIAESGLPEDYEGKSIVHEGPLAYLGGELIKNPYRKMPKVGLQTVQAADGWIGISEKYWLTCLIPEKKENRTFRLLFTPATDNGADHYQTDMTGSALTVAPGQTAETATRFFAGAKEIKTIDAYEKNIPIHHFDLAVDFGLYYFMTKPFFYILDFFGGLLGNFGAAILCLTVIVRLAVFPLANASYRSFAMMKKVGPQMTELRNKYGNDREMLQKEMVALYEREKVNPMAGCLPMLVQIPIFFALYKTLSITIEMRHAPFWGWIQDLSAHDPTSIFNLFGLLPWTPPGPLMIGGWSCLMLIAMLIQKQMNPPPQDPTQAMMNNIMPFLVTYMLAHFASGLVIYWTFSNYLSVLQQYVIMRSLGVEVHFFKKNKADQDIAEMVKSGPVIHPELEVIEHKVEDALFGENDSETSVSRPKPRRKKKR